MNVNTKTAVEEAEDLLVLEAHLGALDDGVAAIIQRLIDEAKRHASRADTAMRRVVELEAEVVRLEEARRS